MDYWTEDHFMYNYTQKHLMPSWNSTLIGVTDVRKHPIYSFYYQNLTRWNPFEEHGKMVGFIRFALLGLLPMLLLVILNVRVFSAIQASLHLPWDRHCTVRSAHHSHLTSHISCLHFHSFESPHKAHTSFFSLSLSQIPPNPQFPGPKVNVQGCQLCAHSPTCRPCLHPLPVTEALPELLGDLPGQVCSNTVWPPSLVWGESKTLLA